MGRLPRSERSAVFCAQLRRPDDPRPPNQSAQRTAQEPRAASGDGLRDRRAPNPVPPCAPRPHASKRPCRHGPVRHDELRVQQPCRPARFQCRHGGQPLFGRRETAQIGPRAPHGLRAGHDGPSCGCRDSQRVEAGRHSGPAGRRRFLGRWRREVGRRLSHAADGRTACRAVAVSHGRRRPAARKSPPPSRLAAGRNPGAGQRGGLEIGRQPLTATPGAPVRGG